MKSHVQIRINEQNLIRHSNYLISVNFKNYNIYSNGLVELNAQGSFFLGGKVSAFGYTCYRNMIRCMYSLLQLQVTTKHN